MKTKIQIQPSTLYPIIHQDDSFQLISDATLFSSLIANYDFSLVMSKLQLLRKKKAPLHLMFSIKTHNGYIPVLMHANYKNHLISFTLENLNQMSAEEMKKVTFQ